MNRLWEWISTLRCTTPEFANNWENAIKQSWKTLKIWDIRLYQIFELLAKFQPKITSEEFSPKNKINVQSFVHCLSSDFVFYGESSSDVIFCSNFARSSNNWILFLSQNFRFFGFVLSRFSVFLKLGVLHSRVVTPFYISHGFVAYALEAFCQCTSAKSFHFPPVSSVAYYNIWLCVVLVSMGWHSTTDYG